jgi:hypothetical protein
MTELIIGGLSYRAGFEIDLGPCDAPELLPAALRAYLAGMARLLREAPPAGFNDGTRFSCYEELVLELGRPMRSAPFPTRYRRGRPRYCYANTLALLSDQPGLRYVEGFAMPWQDGQAGEPTLHCWASNANGRVFDPTWPEPEHSAYYGLVFNLADVARFVALDEDTFGILATEYLIGSPLLTTGRLWPEGRRHER